MSRQTPSPSSFKPGVARRRLAENLRIARLLGNWSQEELAETAGIDRSYLGGIERADRNVSLDHLEKLAHAVGMTVPALLSEPDPELLTEKILELIRNSIDGARLRIREEPAVFCAN